MISLCNGWQFSCQWSEAFLNWETPAESVRLPHTVAESPLHYASPQDYSMLCGYRRKLTIPKEYENKHLFLQFDGAAHIAQVYINGKKAAEHRSGYTAFRVDISALVTQGENCIAVKLDTTENSSVPPFGFVVDYLTYGGLYREVWLDVRRESYIEDVFVTTPTLSSAHIEITACGQAAKTRVRIMDGNTCLAGAEGERVFDLIAPSAEPWDTASPKLYNLVCELISEQGTVLDTKNISFGFRTAEFRADGLYLNGHRLFMRGLNRHQSYPYIGYAAPESLQREDARLLKRELSCNAVRTSHYPQSQYFIDECDRLGLLVFTELPGWQHIGDAEWKKQAIQNVEEMVLQYRNHPSVILWGVRINESLDDDELYKATNALAHKLDSSRATSGVRYIEKSNLLEDVYAYNDFSHTGDNPGVKAKKNVTKNMDKAFFISEHNGHMFPTKSYDPWSKRQEQALRHAKVLSAAIESGEHAGCFGWCMFDYPTHKDFGSGDRVCYHGVMDAFRNPKTAAALYAAQGDEAPVLEVGSPMDIGDYAAGNLGSVFAFTNCDQIKLYKNGDYVTTFSPKKTGGLERPPIDIDDTIGCLLQSNEGFDKGKAEMLRECLCAAGKYGLAAMPIGYKAKLAWCMLRYHMSFADGVALYGRYVGNWGGEATKWRFDGIKNGKTVISTTRCPSTALHVDVKADHTVLCEGETYDMAAVRIRILDEFENLAPYAQLPITLTVSGAAELVGPATVTAEGGMCGCYIRTIGKAGAAELKLTTSQTEPLSIYFEVKL